MPLDDAGHEVVGHRRPVGRRLGIPGEQDAEDLFLGELDGELVDRALVHVTAKIAGCPLAIRTHAPIEPLLQRQMDMKVDRADQVLRGQWLCFFERDAIAHGDRSAVYHASDHATPANEFVLQSHADFIHAKAWFADFHDLEHRTVA